MEPAVLLRAGEPRRGAAALEQLKLGDAITHEGIDYVVDALADYFREGERWKLAIGRPRGETRATGCTLASRPRSRRADRSTPDADRASEETAVVNVEGRAARPRACWWATAANARVDAPHRRSWPDGTAVRTAGRSWMPTTSKSGQRLQVSNWYFQA